MIRGGELKEISFESVLSNIKPGKKFSLPGLRMDISMYDDGRWHYDVVALMIYVQS